MKGSPGAGRRFARLYGLGAAVCAGGVFRGAGPTVLSTDTANFEIFRLGPGHNLLGRGKTLYPAGPNRPASTRLNS